MSRPRKVYEVFSEGNDDLCSFYFSEREARRLAFGPEGEGDWTMATHPDACELLEKQRREIRGLSMQVDRAAFLLAQMLPRGDYGRPDPSKYNEDERDAHNWIVRHSSSVAELHEMKRI